MFPYLLNPFLIARVLSIKQESALSCIVPAVTPAELVLCRLLFLVEVRDIGCCLIKIRLLACRLVELVCSKEQVIIE